jgi:NADPH2:quinone reductase
MRAARIESYEGPQGLAIRRIPLPATRVEDGEVLIKVRAAGVSFPEVLQSQGLYQLKPDLPFTPGAEIAGEVVRATAASGLETGQRVCALSMLGGLAEYAVARADMTFPLPDGVTYEAGASFMFNYGTAYFGLVERGQLTHGERVLVHGAAGGVGTASIQVAKAFGAAEVVGVVSSGAKGEIALSAGADAVIRAEDFANHAASDTKFDIVVDPVGGGRFTDSTRILGESGRLLVVGFTAGSIPSVKVNRLLLKNISVVGVGWGAYAFHRAGHVRAEWDALLPHLQSGRLSPIVHRTYSLDEIGEALQHIASRQAVGKVVVVP